MKTKFFVVHFTWLYYHDSVVIEAFSKRNAINIFNKQYPGVVKAGNGRILSIKGMP